MGQTRIVLLCAALFSVTSCAGPNEWLPHASVPLLTPTYDRSGQATEPTVLYFSDPWQGHHYWMVLSPYPHERQQYENPCILVSEDGESWTVPTGSVNPLWWPGQGDAFADATVVYDDESHDLLVYFLNDVVISKHRVESLLRMTSKDGVNWTSPKVLISGSQTFLNSPSVAKVGRIFHLWTVDTGMGCHTQSSTVNQRTSMDGVVWSDPQPLRISQPGFVIWHLNMVAVPPEGQFMALIAAYPVGTNCGHTSLFFANSNDGISWQTYSQPAMARGTGWDNGQIYRSSLIYDPASGLFRVWYSARSEAREWHIGYTEGKRGDRAF